MALSRRKTQISCFPQKKQVEIISSSPSNATADSQSGYCSERSQLVKFDISVPLQLTDDLVLQLIKLLRSDGFKVLSHGTKFMDELISKAPLFSIFRSQLSSSDSTVSVHKCWSDFSSSNNDNLSPLPVHCFYESSLKLENHNDKIRLVNTQCQLRIYNFGHAGDQNLHLNIIATLSHKMNIVQHEEFADIEAISNHIKVAEERILELVNSRISSHVYRLVSSLKGIVVYKCK